MHPAYPIIVAKAEELGLPLQFRDDLYKHDRQVLSRYTKGPFGWCPYNSGTHMMLVDGESHFTEQYATGRGRDGFWLLTNFPIKHWFIWDGKELLQMKDEEAFKEKIQELHAKVAHEKAISAKMRKGVCR